MIVRQLVIGTIMENTYILGSEDSGDCVIIDPGGEAEKILEEVESLGLKVGMILNTHGHGDHVGGVTGIKNVTGATYGIHAEDQAMLKLDNSWIASIMPGYQTPPEPDMNVVHEQLLEVGSLSLKVIETPGHTLGGVCYYAEGLVFTGDTLFEGSIGRSDLPGGNGGLLIQNIISRLMSLPTDTIVYPGHGPKTTVGREKLTNPFLLGNIL
jgi:glyoxylase-like metal-dependent hydrolase (beta-lactamase superfamily II)